MDKKIVLLALLVILATATIVTIAADAFSKKSLMGSVRKFADQKFFDRTTSSGRVQPVGESMGGGWP
jgi:hypothetical protein